MIADTSICLDRHGEITMRERERELRGRKKERTLRAFITSSSLRNLYDHRRRRRRGALSRVAFCSLFSLSARYAHLTDTKRHGTSRKIPTSPDD